MYAFPLSLSLSLSLSRSWLINAPEALSPRRGPNLGNTQLFLCWQARRDLLSVFGRRRGRLSHTTLDTLANVCVQCGANGPMEPMEPMEPSQRPQSAEAMICWPARLHAMAVMAALASQWRGTTNISIVSSAPRE